MTWKQFLFQPFVHIGGGQALLIGLLATLAMSLVGWAEHQAFDGVLDVHFSLEQKSYWFYLGVIVVSWLVFAALLWGFGAALSGGRIRLIDVFGPLAMAKWVYLIPALLALIVPWEDPTRYAMAIVDTTRTAPEVSPLVWGLFGLLQLITLLCTAWYVVLAYQAYALAANLKRGKAIASYAAALLLAELIAVGLRLGIDWT